MGAGVAGGIALVEVTAWGNQGQVLMASKAIGDGYLFFSTEFGLWDDQLGNNLLIVGSSVVPVPATTWLFT